MSGAAPDRKRKRKRKTRTERNQMSRNHHLQDTETQKRTSSKNKKASEAHLPLNPTTYTLRSGKVGALPSLVPKDYVKATAGTITQGRLTRTLGLFSSSRSSAWAKREPETEEMKKKVESDLKRVLNLSGKNSHSNGNLENTTAAINSENKLDDQSTSITDTHPDATMEVDASVPRSSKILETSTPLTKQLSNEKGSKSATTHASREAGISSAVSEISGSPECPEEILDPVPPIQEIADKIMKELKPKFEKMFPNRDIEMEICCDLQKLLKQSTCHREEASNERQTHLFPGDVALITSNSVLQPSTKSTLPACTSLKATREVRRQHRPRSTNSDSSPRTIIHEPTPFQVRIQDLPEKKDAKSTSSLSQNLLLSDVADEDKIIRINMKHGDSESSDGDDDSGFSIVRYNEFVASARKLEVEVEQERLRQFNSESQHHRRCSRRPADDHISSCNSRKTKSLPKSSDWRCSQAARTLDFSDPQGLFGGVTPSKVNFYHCPSAHHHASSLPDDDFFGYKSINVSSQNWRCCNAARVLDFPEPKGYSLRYVPSSCPTNSVTQNLFGDHCHSHHHYQPDLSSCKSPKPTHNTSDRDRNVFNKTWDKTVRGPFMSPSGYTKERGDISQVGPSLAQSRYNFQEALNSACHNSDAKQTQGSSKTFMDWQSCKGSAVNYRDKRRSCGAESNSLNTWQLLTQPLSELQTHQADLQKQAKDFLDDLDRTTIHHLSDLTGCKTKHAKHLFQRGTPDSSGSPVWISSCVMKDIGLETSSFT